MEVCHMQMLYHSNVLFWRILAVSMRTILAYIIFSMPHISVNSANNNTIFSTELFNRFQELKQDDDFGWMLTHLARKLSKKVNCLTLITDSYYNFVFSNEIFHTFRGIPYFKVLVKDYEDLLAPNFQTLTVIQQSQLKGCNAYIILIANADQTARFLRFGDRHRVLDTRAMYIVIYDPRLFHRELYYLWKKIVNVIFIRKFQEVPRYEFSTVPFPASINSKFVPQRIDTWRAGKFQKDNELFTDKTYNLKNNTLRIAVFDHMPSVVRIATPHSDENSQLANYPAKFGGLEVQILQSLSKAMNFQTVLYEPMNADVEAWGKKQLNGTFSGILGEITTGKCDMALGNFLYTPYNLKLIDLSRPYTTQCFTFLTPESTTDNSWKTLILPFKLYMWIAIILTLITCSFIFYGLAKFHTSLNQYPTQKQKADRAFWKDLLRLWKDEKSKNTMQIISANNLTNHDDENGLKGLYLFQKMEDSLMNAYSMMLLVSLPKMPTGWSLRTLTGWWWIYCLLVTVAYRASMTAILAHPAPKITIDTLEELASSSIGCGGWGEENKKFFTTSLDVAGQRVGKKFDVVYDADDAIMKVAEGGYAYYENIFYLLHAKVKQKLKLMSQHNFTHFSENNGTSETIVKDLHIMGDCVINMPISLGLQKNSPLKPRVDVFLQRVIEAGLVKKWLGDVMVKTTAAEAPLYKAEIKALMSLKKFSGALVALLSGYVIGILVLIGEKIYWYYFITRDPMYDKYSKTLNFGKIT